METELQPHKQKIQKAGKVLWVFSWIWLIFNTLACLTVVGTVITFQVLGDEEWFRQGISGMAGVPGVDKEHIEQIFEWDYDSFQDHFWLTLFYISYALVFFVISMVFILKIAAAWKRCDVFGEGPIRNLRNLGWVALGHGIIGQLWGLIGSFMGNSNTLELLYFSFIRDTCFASFYMNGTGIEWGILALTLSWILKHAQLIREDQELVV